jgi:hypothetical protein
MPNPDNRRSKRKGTQRDDVLFDSIEMQGMLSGVGWAIQMMSRATGSTLNEESNLTHSKTNPAPLGLAKPYLETN